MSLPTIKQLRYFIALEKHQHFGKAAKACFVSQSAFSVAIKELESQLGAQLVDRTNKSVTITLTGREVANHARHCLRDIEYLAEVAQNNQKPLSGRLNLGVIPTIAPFILPNLLSNVRTILLMICRKRVFYYWKMVIVCAIMHFLRAKYVIKTPLVDLPRAACLLLLVWSILILVLLI